MLIIGMSSFKKKKIIIILYDEQKYLGLWFDKIVSCRNFGIGFGLLEVAAKPWLLQLIDRFEMAFVIAQYCNWL